MKNYSKKEKLRSASGMLLAVFFTSRIVFIMSSEFAQGEKRLLSIGLTHRGGTGKKVQPLILVGETVIDIL
jgi:hypothetical protein